MGAVTHNNEKMSLEMALLFNEAFTHWVIISILLITSRIGFLKPNCWAQVASEAEASQSVLRLGQFGKGWAIAKLKIGIDFRSQACKDICTSQCQFLGRSVTYSIVLYLLTILWLNKKQLGHPWWLLADCYLVPWTLLCSTFTLALVFIQSLKGQTLNCWYWAPVLTHLPCSILSNPQKDHTVQGLNDCISVKAWLFPSSV